MTKSHRLLTFAILLSVLACSAIPGFGEEPKPIQLPPPQTEIGKPLMQALKLRQTSRSFDSRALPLQELSNLLWAADGINRPDTGKRTAPSAMNWQEVDVYVALPDALYLYEPKTHRLSPVVAKDLRAATGQQDFVKDAPLNLVYVVDRSRTRIASADDQQLYSAADVGFIAQNVYLYCASQGLAVVVRGSIDRASLATAMKLRPEHRIVLAQTVGYPK
ncbi:MAG TPA: SagB/ThcOx family dehydrogenase [Verrucomicrobiae bacterium]|nr:SagB/ThcOx family dehydrogenase [Verrucomicrobiae bacterium]